MAESFNQNVEALFRGMEQFMTSKTVVGQPVMVGNATIIPLVDVSFGMMASNKAEPQKHGGGGGMGGKMVPSAVLVIQNGNVRMVNIKNQDGLTKLLDLVPDLVGRFGSKDPKVEKAVSEAAENAASSFGGTEE